MEDTNASIVDCVLYVISFSAYHDDTSCHADKNNDILGHCQVFQL